MSDTFYFLNYDVQTIDKNKFLCIHVLNAQKYLCFRIFKKYTEDLKELLEQFSQFDDISQFIVFAIKRDGKISLDINI